MLKGFMNWHDWWVEWCKTAPNIGRRAYLKALRDYMQPMNRKQLRRAAKRPAVR